MNPKSFLLATLVSGIFAAEALAGNAIFDQREFAKSLITALKWEGGLPREPKDVDILAILNGNRTYRFEAEETYDRTRDTVTVRTFNMYGGFSGKGWVHGISLPTPAHFSLFIPIEGEYLFTVTAKGDGQEWRIGGKTFRVNSGGGLRATEVGQVFLKAGQQTVEVLLPPEGAVDNLTLSAFQLRPVAPLSGWRLPESIKRVEAAELAVALLGLEMKFSHDASAAPYVVAVADAVKLPPAVSTETATYYGTYTSSKWVRAGNRTVPLEIPLVVEKSGMYSLKVRHLGGRITAELDGFPLRGEGKSYFYDVDLGVHFLARGNHRLVLNLQPTNGVDTVRLERKKSSPTDFISVAGMSGKPDEKLSAAEGAKLIKDITSRFKERK